MMRTLLALLVLLAITGAFGFAPMMMARSSALHGFKASTVEAKTSSPRAHWDNVKWCSRSKLWVTADTVAPVPSSAADVPTEEFNMWSGMKYEKGLWVNAGAISSAIKKPAANSRAGRATALMTLLCSTSPLGTTLVYLFQFSTLSTSVQQAPRHVHRCHVYHGSAAQVQVRIMPKGASTRAGK
eukprot:17716-Heterococcus_DN1.PRE.4